MTPSSNNIDITHVREPFSNARLEKPMSKLLQDLYEKATIERELKVLDVVLKVDCAHVVMLADVGLITEAQAAPLLKELDNLRKTGQSHFVSKPGFGSIALQIENFLSDRLGQDTAGRLPIARSRIDHSATVRRISDRDAVLQILQEVLHLHQVLGKVASKYGETASINYTHLQQAQPATFGHYLLAFQSRLGDSFEQLREIYNRIDRCPLGAVGLSGTDLPIDRQKSASLLGFAAVLGNSRQGRDNYYQVELVFALALAAIILNDLCTDLHVQSSIEVGTVELCDSHCSTSSVFPQKKNPIALEIVKGKAGEAHGWVPAALAAFRNEGTGDQQARYVACLNDAVTTLTKMLQLTSEVVDKLTFNEQRSQELLHNAWVTTNRLGNVLLTKYALDYRTAHGLVGRVVKSALAKGVAKSDLKIDLLQDAAEEMGIDPIPMSEGELVKALDHTDFIKCSISQGGVGPTEFQCLLAIGGAQYDIYQSWLVDRRASLQRSDAGLEASVARLTVVNKST